MKRKIMLLAALIGRGIFKGAALVGALVLIIALWFWDASLLTMPADESLYAVKSMTHLGCRVSFSSPEAIKRCGRAHPSGRSAASTNPHRYQATDNRPA
jgi:hypothetical protein